MTAHTPQPLRLIAIASLLAAFLFCFSPAAMPQGTLKIGAIHIKGLAHFNEAQVVPLLKLSAGAPFSQPALDAATQKLGETGGAVIVDFLVKETAKFRRCLFDNFPFATSAEIVSYVQQKVPLFDGSAPDTGSILEEVDSALADFAKSRGVSATVEHVRYTRLGSSDLEYLFRRTPPPKCCSRPKARTLSTFASLIPSRKGWSIFGTGRSGRAIRRCKPINSTRFCS